MAGLTVDAWAVEWAAATLAKESMARVARVVARMVAGGGKMCSGLNGGGGAGGGEGGSSEAIRRA